MKKKKKLSITFNPLGPTYCKKKKKKSIPKFYITVNTIKTVRAVFMLFVLLFYFSFTVCFPSHASNFVIRACMGSIVCIVSIVSNEDTNDR